MTKIYNLSDNAEEMNYLQLLQETVLCGSDVNDRTGIGTRRLLGHSLRFDLTKGFPLLTTKKVFWKGVVLELLWFLSGDTNSRTLSEQGVKIWDANAAAFAKQKGLDVVGELGPVYGQQWRRFNGDEVKGDQISNLINQIKADPHSRRLIVNAWNPLQIDQMALPPCHVMFQFAVEEEKYLTCCLYARSQDLFLGTPFNISSYALLTHMIAHVTGLIPKQFIWFGFDCHVYHNHFDAVAEQTKRKPYPFPKLEITRNVSSIFDFKYDDFKLIDYNCHPAIKAEMAV